MDTIPFNELPFISNPAKLSAYLNHLHKERKASKLKGKRGTLTKEQRKLILQKTDSKCHICGIPLTSENFQADHVKSHVTGGTHTIDNYLPGCKTCNNYRWHYNWQEIQYILKIGVWAKSLIERNNSLGKTLAEEFVAYEIKREKRRKLPR